MPHTYLLTTLRAPGTLAGLSAAEQSRVLRELDLSHLSAVFCGRWRDAPDLPPPSDTLGDRCAASAIIAHEHARRVSYELTQVRRALRGTDWPVLVLKGGAYITANMAHARGRLVSDLDLLVHREHLPEIEAHLRERHWQPQKIDDYEQHYYRQWMHELPPLAHPERGIVIDLHHNILPLTGRIRINADLLWDAAVPLEGGDGLLRLGDADMVLHVCLHLFQDGEVVNRLRELIDLESLLTFGARTEGFWEELFERAQLHGARRPLAYGLVLVREMLGYAVPDELHDRARRWLPAYPLRGLMLASMRRALLPLPPESRDSVRGLAARLLYLRSHWLRMPPLMLARHLLTQARRRGGLKAG